MTFSETTKGLKVLTVDIIHTCRPAVIQRNKLLMPTSLYLDTLYEMHLVNVLAANIIDILSQCTVLSWFISQSIFYLISYIVCLSYTN